MNTQLRITFFVGLLVFVFFGMSPNGLAQAAAATVRRTANRANYAIAGKPKATKELKVPFHRQEKSLSCELASLKSALMYKGVTVSESELREKIAYDPTPKANGVWGNPHKGFVGKIDGKMPSTGYGVYWEPIAELGGKYRPTEAFTHGTLDKVLSEIDQGNPVEIWGHLGSGQKTSWNTPDGEKIKGVLYEHSKLVIGYVGKRSNPTGVYLMDPVYGRVYQSKQTFMKNWSKLDYSGVIIR